MSVPFIDLKRSNALIQERVLKNWATALGNCEFVGGPAVGRLEAAINQRLKARQTVACANGTDAILIGLQALGVGTGTKVALPNLTFWATYEAVAQLGGIPVLVDISERDQQMSYPAFVEAWKEHHFSHAILVHLFGWASADLAKFRRFCKENGIALLEDGAQSFGVEVDGEPVYASAEVSTLSFYPAKVLGGAMDGGAICFGNPETAERLAGVCRSLANHGRSTHYSYAHVGWNSRMAGMNAHYILEAFEISDQLIRSRNEAVSAYREILESSAAPRLKDEFKLHLPPAGQRSNGYLLVIECARPIGEELNGKLKESGIGCGRVYPEPMDAQPPATVAIRAGSLEASRRFCRSVINLPLFYGIQPEEVRESAEAFIQALSSLTTGSRS